MAIKNDVAFVIRRIDFRESDYIVTLFGKEVGKFVGIAKGARKSDSKFGGVFDLLNLSEIVYYEGSGLDFISEGEAIRTWEGIRKSGEAINVGLRCARSVDRLLEEGGRQKEVYDLFKQTLSSLDQSQEGARTLELAFYLKLFHLLGYKPELERCTKCGKTVEGESRLHFSPKDGGVICSDCGAEEGLAISGGLRKNLIKLLSLPPTQVRRLKLSSELLEKSFLLLEKFGRYHFDRKVLSNTAMGGPVKF
ncbi:MAG: DNA repair protein RecO [Candidatus Bipolaricaulota bacterium]